MTIRDLGFLWVSKSAKCLTRLSYFSCMYRRGGTVKQNRDELLGQLCSHRVRINPHNNS